MLPLVRNSRLHILLHALTPDQTIRTRIRIPAPSGLTWPKRTKSPSDASGSKLPTLYASTTMLFAP